MLEIPWKVRGICISAPKPGELELFENFVEQFLVPGGCNLIVLLLRYRYQFKSHPECANPDEPLDAAQAKQIVDLCKKHGVRLVPKMNLLGHQSGKGRDSLDGLLRGHPEYDETPEMDEVYYCRSLCPNHPEVTPIVFDLMDEMIGAFNSDGIHIGMDEVFDIGKCPRCKDTPTYKIFSNWVNTLASHNEASGKQTLMWGDRLLNGLETGYGAWEASGNFTDPAIQSVNKNILICDWHYEDRKDFPSVDAFANAGFKMMVCPWRYRANAEKFIEYAKEHDKGHIEGLLATTWINPGDIMRNILHGKLKEGPRAATVEALSDTLNWIFK
jgi:hypothetical protein